MGKPTGFKEFPRQTVPYRDPLMRLEDFNEIFTAPAEQHLRTQGARCMDCGVPFCQSATGCPIDNLIPEWNDLVYRGHWRAALDRLFHQLMVINPSIELYLLDSDLDRPQAREKLGVDYVGDQHAARKWDTS